MKKILKFLFEGNSKILAVGKPTVWLMLTLLLVSLIENGGNDGVITEASQYVLIFGGIFTGISIVFSLEYAYKLERARKRKPVQNTPPLGTMPPVGPPVNFPTDPGAVYPNFPLDATEKGGAQ